MDDSADSIDYSASSSVEEQERAADCPTCGAEAEGSLTCPRCGARTHKSIPLDLLLLIAGVGVILGLILLSAATLVTAPASFDVTTVSEIHNNNIASTIKPGASTRQVKLAYNRAIDRIRGAVTYPGQINSSPPKDDGNQFKISVQPARVTGRVSDVRVEEGSDNFTIELSGGESSLRVRGFGELSDFREQLGDRFPPDLFDRISVVGSLSFDSNYGPSVFLSVPGRYQIVEKFERVKRSLASLTTDDVGEYYVVEGKVRSVARPGKLRIITFEDRGVFMDLAVPDFQFKKLPERLQNYLTTKGARLEILAQISQYRGEVQLSLANPDDPETIKPVGGQ